MMFSPSFVGGGRSKSAEGGPNLLADLDRRGPYPLVDVDRGSISASGFGPGGPNLGGSKSAGTPGQPQPAVVVSQIS